MKTDGNSGFKPHPQVKQKLGDNEYDINGMRFQSSITNQLPMVTQVKVGGNSTQTLSV